MKLAAKGRGTLNRGGRNCRWDCRDNKQCRVTVNNKRLISKYNQSRTNGPINAHLTIAQVMPKYNHNNEKQEALL